MDDSGTSCIVLAAGSQSRFSDGIKELLEFGEEPLIVRTLRQIRDRGLHGLAFTHKLEVQKLCSWILVEPSRWKIESVLSCRPMWGTDKTVIFLGDVIYSKDLMDKITKSDKPIEFFVKKKALPWGGFVNELLAMSFTKESYLRAQEILEYVCEDASKDAREKGRLLTFCRAWSGIVPIKQTLLPYGTPPFTEIVDYSTDFDIDVEYDLFLERETIDDLVS